MILNFCSEKLIRISGIFVLISIIANTEIVSRLCAIDLLITCIVLGKRETSILNPYLLFAVTPLTLACYVDISDVYMPPLSNKTFILSLINIYAFIIALFYSKPFGKISNCLGVFSKKYLRLHACILFLLSLLGIVVPALSAVLWLFRLASYACIIKSKEKKLILLIFLNMAITMASGEMSKMGVLLDVLTISICYFKYYKITSAHKFKILAIAVAGIAIMLFSFRFATKGDGTRDSNDVQSQVLRYENTGDFSWNYSAALFLPYMYLESAWYNVQYVMETQDNRTYGLWTVKPFLGFVGLDDYFEKKYSLDSNSSFNTFTFITTGFKDYGYWLSFLSPLLLGFFVKKIYSRFLMSRSPFDVACYVAVSLATFQMYFSNHFFMQSYPFTIVIIMELYKIFLAKPLGGRIEIENP